jgi:hypothetical protein
MVISAVENFLVSVEREHVAERSDFFPKDDSSLTQNLIILCVSAN